MFIVENKLEIQFLACVLRKKSLVNIPDKIL